MPRAMKKQVRFLHNFIITVIQTVEDENGRLVVKENTFHIGMGDTYAISNYNEHPDGRVDLHFADNSPLVGVARNVEGDYCELRTARPPKKVVETGCGGCGKNRKKKEPKHGIS